MMIRIVWHWTGGTHKANTTDKRHYHFIIEGDGTVVAGNHPPEANAVIHSPNDGSTYAAHTSRLNTGSIGIAVAAMRGAQERPLNVGTSPITEAQVEALVALTARLCAQYNITVQKDTVLSHAEVQPTLKVAQRNKWDITWLPGMVRVADPIIVGDMLRDRVTAAMAQSKPNQQNILATLIEAIVALFTKARK
jgi:N-acetyl-anhydromuramyl-L-alanine amidase AmpD